jgi:hypothetical protein
MIFMYPSVFYGNKTKPIIDLIKFLSFLILGIIVVTCIAGEWSGEALYRSGIGLSEPDRGDIVLNDSLLEIGWKTAESLGWNFAAKARYRHEDRLEPDTFEEFTLRRFVISHEATDWGLSIGKQAVVWGKMDGFPLLDIINPRNTREFVLDDEARSRIPLWLAEASYYWRDQSLEFIVVPELEPNRVPQPGGVFDPIQAKLPQGIDLRLSPLREPEQSRDNWEFGLKWSGRVGVWELSSVVFHGWSNQPVYFTKVADTHTLTVEPELVRQTLIGVSGDAPYGSTVWRFEAVYTPDDFRTFTTDSGIPVQRRQSSVHMAVGMDWTPNNWLLGGQFFHFEDDGEDAGLAIPSGDYITAVVQKFWLQRRLKMRLFTMRSVDRSDHWLSTKLSYDIKGRYQLTLRGDWFGGEKSGFFGQFNDRDRLMFAVSVKL